MKKNIIAILVSILSISGYSQQIKQHFISCDAPNNELNQELKIQPNESVEIRLIGKKGDNIKKVFFNSKFQNLDIDKEALFEVMKSANESLSTAEAYLKDSLKSGQSNKPDTLYLLFTPSMLGADSIKFIFSNDKTPFEVLSISKNKPNDMAKKPVSIEKIEVVTPEMLSKINGSSGCQLCDTYAKPEGIDSKKDRKYSTDYIVIYDPSLKKDAYTICKHVFERRNSKNEVGGDSKKFMERYIKIGAMWFAPHVGSQIRFEVINQPLNKPLKLTVDEQDLFNAGSGQFASIISGLINSNIITPISGSGNKTSKDTGTTSQSSQDSSKIIAEQLNQVASQVLEYVIQFKISSCALQEHQANLSKIITKINEVFSLTAFNADQLAIQLKNKVENEVTDETIKSNALKEVDAIIQALKSLENVQPLAYTTLRAKNRDFIEIKYTDANNVVSKPENIRMSGGMKIDFSGGFVLTGLKDYTYTLKEITVKYPQRDQSDQTTPQRDTTGKVIIKEDDGNNQVGVCLLSHFYPRISSHYNFGGTFGLMTSTSLNLRLMLGGSFMVSSLFGSNNRISFSGGVVWGKVKRLSSQHSDFLNQPRFVNKMPQFYSQASAPEPIDRNEKSWFFAITMNFGGN